MRQLLRPEVGLARKLRRKMTLPEVLLWQRLKGAILGVRFRRQHPIGPYLVDFYCAEQRLAIEVDGQVHGDRVEQDKVRDAFLKENGCRVIHIPAHQILCDPDTVAASIGALVARPLHQPMAGPPPRAGEDRE